MNYSLPISPSYRSPIFQAVGLQAMLVLLCSLNLDGGDSLHICGMALLGFWAGAIVMICRSPRAPSKKQLEWIRFGFLPVLVLAFAIVHLVWALKG